MKRKRKIKNYVKIGFLFLGMSLLLNCEQEESFNPTETSTLKITQRSIEEFQSSTNTTFNKAMLSLESLGNTTRNNDELYNFTIDSSMVREIIHNNKTSYTFLIHRENSNSESFENLLISIDSLEVASSYLITYTPSSSSIFLPAHNAVTFEGSARITQLDTELLDIPGRSTETCNIVTTTWCDALIGEGIYSTVHVADESCYTYTPWAIYTSAELICEEDTVIDAGDSPSGGGDTDGNGAGNAVTTTPIIPCRSGDGIIGLNGSCIDAGEYFEENIDDTDLEPCLKTILNDLKNIESGIGHIITKFAGNDPGYNWKVKDSTLSGTNTAFTESPAHYNSVTGTITTTFDSQTWLNATDISWARTILHESVHAYLSVFFKTDRPNWIATYPEMVQEWGTFQNWNDVHHEEFARSLIDQIALSLKEYGEFKGYNLSNQFYEDMAWGGLQDTSLYQALPIGDKNRISDVLAIELTGQDIQNNSQNQKGVNAGC